MVRKAGLGRGLEALIPAGETAAQADGILQVPVEKIFPNPLQPRTHLDASSMAELTASIREHGLLQPLVVRQDLASGDFYLIAGERRWRASQLAGLKTVPVMLRDATPQEQLELALIENLQRADLGPIETAEAYRHLTEDFGLSQDDVAARVGRGRTTVTNTLRLLKLPRLVQAAVAEGRITEGHARALLGLNTAQAQTAALETILKLELNVRQTEDLVHRLAGERGPSSRPRREVTPEIRAIEERLRGHLGTRVDVHHGEKGGSVVIRYYSDEELDAIIAQILHE